MVEEVGYDGAFTFVYSPVAAPWLPRWKTRLPIRSRSNGWNGWSRRSSAGPGAGAEVRRPQHGGCWSRGPSRNDPTWIRGRSRHNKAVNFEGTAEAGQMVEVEIGAATSQTLTGTERLLSGIGA